MLLPKIYNGRDKTFWFFAYEGLRQRQSVFDEDYVPTPAMFGGDFSQVFDNNGTLLEFNDNWQQSKAKWVFVGFLLIAGYLLATEHRAHLYGWLSAYGIWLFLLACPLMHLFMHSGHDHGGHESSSASNESTKDSK